VRAAAISISGRSSCRRRQRMQTDACCIAVVVRIALPDAAANRAGLTSGRKMAKRALHGENEDGYVVHVNKLKHLYNRTGRVFALTGLFPHLSC
jgi:hypothetical protein